MKNIKRFYAIVFSVIYTSMSAQYSKENSTTIAVFKLMDARDNGNDLTLEALKDNCQLFLYKTKKDNQINML